MIKEAATSTFKEQWKYTASAPFLSETNSSGATPQAVPHETKLQILAWLAQRFPLELYPVVYLWWEGSWRKELSRTHQEISMIEVSDAHFPSQNWPTFHTEDQVFKTRSHLTKTKTIFNISQNHAAPSQVVFIRLDAQGNSYHSNTEIYCENQQEKFIIDLSINLAPMVPESNNTSTNTVSQHTALHFSGAAHTYFKINFSGHHLNQLNWTKCLLQNKELSYFLWQRGSNITKEFLTTELLDASSNLKQYCLAELSNKEHFDFSSLTEHLTEQSISTHLIKTLIDHEAKGIITGKIKVHPSAQKISAQYLNKNLLLSKKAHIHAQPQLEIFADDVKCSHGSSTGSLQFDELFYLQTRGFDQQAAQKILMQGFVKDILLQVQHSAIVTHLQSLKDHHEL